MVKALFVVLSFTLWSLINGGGVGIVGGGGLEKPQELIAN